MHLYVFVILYNVYMISPYMSVS